MTRIIGFVLCLFTSFSYGVFVEDALYLSQATYCETSQDWSCKTCNQNLQLLETIENYGEKALINKKDNTLFVSFRGSTNIQNWLDNVQFTETCPYTDTTICVETGFYKVYNAMKPNIFDSIEKYENMYPIQNIVFTGHSLGASVATLMVYNYSGNCEKELITFGSPRIGNDAFVNDFILNKKIKTSRITHYYDIVPHLPQMFLNYIHVPHESWYNEENTVYIDCNDSYDEEDSKCSNSCGPLHCTSIDDHLHYLNITMGTDGDC